MSLFDIIILQAPQFLCSITNRYIDCHKSEFPTLRGSLSRENSSRPAQLNFLQPCTVTSTRKVRSPTRCIWHPPQHHPNNFQLTCFLEWMSIPQVQRSAHHPRPSLSNASSQHPPSPRHQHGSMERWPSWSTDESLSFRRNPMLCQEFAAIAFQHIAANKSPWPHCLLHPFSIIDSTKNLHDS